MLMTLPPVIDALDFAGNAGTYHGKISISALERLQDYLADNLGSLEYGIAGALDDEGRPVLRIQIYGIMHLRCQRCLEKILHILDINTALLLARDEDELLRLDEGESADCILGRQDLNVPVLIEDEIILSLPFSPRHSEEKCAVTGGQDGNADERMPFAALSALKRSH